MCAVPLAMYLVHVALACEVVPVTLLRLLGVCFIELYAPRSVRSTERREE